MEDDLEWTPFRPFTRESLFNIERRIAEEQAAKEAEKTHAQHGDDSSSDDDDDVEEPTHEPEPKPNPKLEAGRKLPPSLEDVPNEYVGIPLEDLDEYYHNQKVSRGVNTRLVWSALGVVLANYCASSFVKFKGLERP
nr:hypothetical protein BaRGS_020143 [Batillaria attramentaria]